MNSDQNDELSRFQDSYHQRHIIPNTLGKLIISMALYGHFFTQIPHPIHNSSEITLIFEVLFTCTHNVPISTRGQYRLHSRAHLDGLHYTSSYKGTSTLSPFTLAIRVLRSNIAIME